jgi:lipoprotein NlpD
VQPGENLFRIALSHHLKYQVLASWNNLPDYSIKVGQVLRLTPPSASHGTTAMTMAPDSTKPVNESATASAVKTYPKALKLAYSDTALHTIAVQSEGTNKTTVPAQPSSSAKPESSAAASQVESSTGAAAPEASAAKAAGDEGVAWIWPASGKVLRGFSDNNKGVDIGGRMGQPVLAAGDGKVVYSGNGLRGYGKLIIIKHNKTYLSAYAHNSQLLVKEGQSVKKGQKIAEMGNSDADQVKLHFEIRRFGKPVDPMQYLNSRP